MTQQIQKYAITFLNQNANSTSISKAENKNNQGVKTNYILNPRCKINIYETSMKHKTYP